MYERKPVENPIENQVQDMPERMVLESMDIAAEKREQLKQLFPEVFNEDKVDFERLQRVLGEQIDTGKERYGLTWPGKAECMKVIQEPSRATLKPCREESVNFDDTENLFIEGDNLEVLKLLQKSYFGKVKMIYIDPPYNTGKEFIYPDNYQETIETYLAYAGLVDANGKKFTTNTATEGRFHSKWLNMMYPRLYLAKNLLREDGVIFISIDDNEVSQLRKACDEIFGDDNFVANLIWQKKYTRANDAKWFSDNHDHILVYAKSKELFKINPLPRNEDQLAAYINPDNHPKGPWKATPLHAKSGSNTKAYTFKNGVNWQPPAGTFRRFNDEAMRSMDEGSEIWFGADGRQTPSRKSFLSEVKGGVTPITLWNYEEVGHNHEASNELKSLSLNGVFNNPKPTRLISRIIELSLKKGEKNIVLDFFGGSATTAHAVFNYCLQSRENINFIVVQLPEPCDQKSEAAKQGYVTIADISKERIRRAANKISADKNKDSDDLDLGVRVYKLAKSHFGQWRSEVESGNVAQLQANLELHTSHISEEAEQEALLYELLLKAGFALTESIEQKTLGNQTVFSVAEGTLLICLENTIEPETIEKMVEAEPAEIIVKDSAFAGNDQLKVNAVQTVKAYNQNSETDIVFKVV